MKTLTFGIALGIAALGIVGIFLPSALLWLAPRTATPVAFSLIGAVRIAFGLLLISVASSSRAPKTLRVLGYFIVIAGIATSLTGLVAIEYARALIEWWTRQDSYLIRFSGVVLVILGSFIVYACAPDRRSGNRTSSHIIGVVLFGAGCLAAEAAAPERKVEHNNVLISAHDPKVRIELRKPVQYVGADRWVLFGIADCELHAFVEADGQKRVRRLYWVQFEGYLPTKPKLRHQYRSPRHATIGGLDFYVDTWTSASDDKVTPGSDTEHIQALIRARGYKMPAGMMSVRLVHLLDAQKRKELMIIYSEDLAATRFTAADLKQRGKEYDEWPAIEAGLVERAKKKIKISTTVL